MTNFVNFMSNVSNQLDVTPAGYVQFSQNKPDRTPTEEDFLDMKVGFHGKVQVTYGFTKGNEHEIVHDASQVINQVFTAAVDFGSTNINYRSNEQKRAWGQTILDAAYEGTLRSAILAQNKKVFLTLVGGGVFHNPLKDIVSAIQRNNALIQESGLSVTLVVFDGKGQYNNVRGDFLELVKRTGGTYVKYTGNTGKDLACQCPK